MLLIASSARGTPSAVSVVVTTTSDLVNGDVSSVTALEANPGPDGISLPEAIEATDNAPGTYDISFDSSLKGATILIGTIGRCLPPLTGGGVSINGDVDGNGRPDVTIAASGPNAANCGFDVASSDNRLQALALRGFYDGVRFTAAASGQALPTGRTFTGNIVSNLSITAMGDGILLQPAGPDAGPNPGHPECVASACRTDDSWTDMQLVGNTIEAGRAGIDVSLTDVASNTVTQLAVERNAISLTASAAQAIDFTAGGGAHADSNQITGVVVSGNTIDSPVPGLPRQAINIWSGHQGGSSNVVEGMRIAGNTIHFEGAMAAGSEVDGIAFAIADDCYPVGCPPGAAFPRHDVVRNVQIVSNLVEGAGTGIVVSDLCCAHLLGNELTGVRITGNTIEGSLQPHDREPLGIAIGGGAAVSDVVVNSNTIVQQAPGPRSDYAAHLAAGGIGVFGGLGLSRGSVRDVVIAHNRVDTPLAGVTIIGGGPPSDPAAGNDAMHDRVYDIVVQENTIAHAPTLATRWNHRVKGIDVIGGLGAAPATGRWRQSTQNSVACVRLKDNTVVGKRNSVSVFANLGGRATRNTARLGGC